MNVLTTQKQDTTFTRVSDIVIPNAFFNRMKTGIAQFDTLFGEGILPGSTFTFTGSAGVGKCHGPNEAIEVFGSEEDIAKLSSFLANKAGKAGGK